MGSNPSNVWSAHQLAEFVAGMSDHRDLTRAVDSAIDQLCETFDAEFAAIVEGTRVLGSTGFGAHEVAVPDLMPDILAGATTTVDVPGAGTCTALVRSHLADGIHCHLVIARTSPNRFNAEEQSLLRNMSRVFGLSLQTFRLLSSLRERQHLLERLSVIQRSISRRAGLDNVLSSVITGVVELLEADAALIRLVAKEHPDDHVLVASHGVPENVVRRIQRIPVGSGITGRALREGTLVLGSDPIQDVNERGYFSEIGALSMAAPIHDAGNNVGAIAVAFHGSSRREFTEGEQEALSLFAEHASIALTDARTVEAMEMAMYDPLTHLPNRVLFHDRLAQARSEHDEKRHSAVLFLDLDGFKRVNDTMGHGAGDELLGDLALRLSWLVRPGDLVGRHGGDEFTVLLHGLEQSAEAEAIAQRILDGLREPFMVGGHAVQIGASIGIAFDDGDQLSDLVARADLAMYAAKQHGRGRFEVYSDQTALRNRQSWTPTL